MSSTKNELIDETVIALKNVREKVPLTNCITNYITINDCANAILAIGGSPIMGDNPIEIEEFIEIVDSLVINMGATTKSQIEAIKIGSDYAKKSKTPIVLDPVGVGISNLRNEVILELINDSKLSAIRGNMSEIKAIAKLIDLKEIQSSAKNKNENKNESKDESESKDEIKGENKSKGVDVSENDVITKENLKDNGKIVQELAKKIKTVIIASGAIDIISDGKSTYACENGDPMMPKITGSGCMLTSILGSFCGANDPFIGAVATTLAMGIAGKEAGKFIEKENSGPGTFRVKLIDYLYKINEELISKEAKLYKINLD